MSTPTRKRSPGEVWEALSSCKSPREGEAKQKAIMNEERLTAELQLLLFQVKADELDDILWAIYVV